MTVSPKIKTINNRFKLNKAQDSLNRQTAEILTLSKWNVSKYRFLTGEDVLVEKYFLETSKSKDLNIGYYVVSW